MGESQLNFAFDHYFVPAQVTKEFVLFSRFFFFLLV